MCRDQAAITGVGRLGRRRRQADEDRLAVRTSMPQAASIGSGNRVAS